jgi:hypothetical protein
MPLTVFPTHRDRINDRFGPAHIAPPTEPVIIETPGELFSDRFEGPVGSSLAGRVVGSTSWSTPAGSAKIDRTGRVTATSSMRGVVNAGSADGALSVTFGLTNYDVGVVFRWTSTSNYLRVILVEGKWICAAMVNGGYRELARGDSGCTRCSTVTLGVTLVGSSITLSINGNVVKTLTSTHNITGKSYGLYTQNGGDRSFEHFAFQCPSTITVVEAPPVLDTRPVHFVSPTFKFPIEYKNIPPRCAEYQLGTPNQDNADYWSDGGQAGYCSRDPLKAGLMAMQTFAYYDGTFATSPRNDVMRGTVNPDPSTRIAAYITANGGQTPNDLITQVRSVQTTSNDAFCLWANGLITVASTQTGHGSSIWPWVKLDDTKEVMDMAVTSMNELLLVAVRDTVRNVGQLAVIMVEAWGISFHTFREMGLPNQSSTTALKLLGYIDLPVASTLKVSAASNAFWNGVSSTMVRVVAPDGTSQNVGLSLGQMSTGLQGTLSFTRQGVKVFIDPEVIRGNLKDGGWRNVIADSGYAVVASRDENKAIVVDLSPVFRYIRQGWLETPTSYAENRLARTAGTWPVTFEENAEMMPVIHSAYDIEKPSSVICGHSMDRWSGDVHKFHVGTQSGHLHIYDASLLMARIEWEEKSSSIHFLGAHYVGENLCAMAFSRRNEGAGTGIFDKDGQRGDGKNSVIWAVCRKERKLVCLVTFRGKIAVIRTVEDQLLVDPVSVAVAERGYIVLIADFGGKQVVGLRVGSITDVRTSPDIVYPVRCVEGGPQVDFEISGILPLDGEVHCVSSANIN